MEPLGERQRQQEGEQNLHAGLRDPKLLQQLGVVAVGALVLGLITAVALRVAVGFRRRDRPLLDETNIVRMAPEHHPRPFRHASG
jgi:hypothetical protein